MYARRLAAVLCVLFAVLLAAPTPAAGYQNGKLPKSQLARIYNGPVTGHSYLAKRPAAGFNSLNLCAWHQKRARLYPTGPLSAYRNYAGQVKLARLYGYPRAARAGTSNHGLGKAIDLPLVWMQSYIRAHGKPVRWGKVEAFHEAWHFNSLGSGHGRPNPGPSVNYPLTVEGSGGACQAFVVKRLKQHLRRHRTCRTLKVTGSYGSATRKCVIRFQRTHHLAGDGRVGSATWKALRKPRRR